MGDIWKCVVPVLHAHVPTRRLIVPGEKKYIQYIQICVTLHAEWFEDLRCFCTSSGSRASNKYITPRCRIWSKENACLQTNLSVPFDLVKTKVCIIARLVVQNGENPRIFSAITMNVAVFCWKKFNESEKCSTESMRFCQAKFKACSIGF